MNDLISAISGDASGLEMMIMILAGGSVISLGLALWLLARPLFDPVRQRLASLGKAEPSPPALSRMEQHHGLQLFTDREKDTRQQLTLAGYRSPATLGNFYILRTLLIILLTVAAILFQSRQDTWTLHSAILWFGSAYLAGMQLPRWFLLNRQARFQRLLSEALPDAIDLLIVCVQAGLGLNAALVRMAREIQHLHPVLFAEIDRLNAEIAAGQDRAEALRGLASRTGQQDIRALTSLLLQSLRFGTSITETLHVFGDELREKRLQRAEEQAAKMATKLVFPLIFCLLPAFLITAVGPGFLQIMRFFSH
ncbi:MAG: hypothetical protein RIQ52_1160 [Pseudomonadota bacterium]|jgi:tight adherence protein C